MKQQLSEARGSCCADLPPIWQRLEEAAKRYPQGLAVASLHNESSLYGIGKTFLNAQYLQWSYSDLTEAVDNLVSALSRLEVANGTAIATILDNSVEFLVAACAAHKLGRAFVPLSRAILPQKEEVHRAFRLANISSVIVQDEAAAKLLDAALGQADFMRLKIVASESFPDSWIPLRSLLSPSVGAKEIPKSSWIRDETVAILFTSGTTSLPKAAPHSDSTLNGFSRSIVVDIKPGKSILCPILPNNHIMGYISQLSILMSGASIVIASPKFDPVSFVRAIESAGITHTALVPAMLPILLEVIKAQGRPIKSSLDVVVILGSAVSAKDLSQIISGLGSKAVTTGFGMTEGMSCWNPPSQDPHLLAHGDLSVVGKPCPGAHVRICAPNSRTPVPIGVYGELHQTGPSLIEAYLGDNVGRESFYQDEEDRRWFITGDQAVMYPDGSVSITGRIKDMIIRGGENISPAAIESAFVKFFGIQAQVVGAPDDVAGEIIVVVTPKPTTVPMDVIRDKFLAEMGPLFVPDRMFALPELGLTNFPMTVSNKVQKTKLAETVRLHLESTEAQLDAESLDIVKSAVLRAYHKATGVPVGNLDHHAPITTLTDSISAMRVREYVRRSLGMTLTMVDMRDYPTISSQIKILLARKLQSDKDTYSKAVSSRPAPTLNELADLFGGIREAKRMHANISEMLQLHGLKGFEDVMTISPVHDYLQVLSENKIIDTWNITVSLFFQETNTKVVRAALEKALANNPNITAFMVRDRAGQVYNLMVRPSQELFNECIVESGFLNTADEVRQLTYNCSEKYSASSPGPFFKCRLFFVEEQKSIAMVMNVNHLGFDASALRLFYEDLETALSYPSSTLSRHVDWKLWADSYNALRNSPAATKSVQYHVQRLAGINNHMHAIYPAEKKPRKALSDSPDGIDVTFDAPGLVELREAHPNITASIVLNAAVALVNTHRTGHSHSIFTQFEAGRLRFPFIPDAVESVCSTSLNAPDVCGPVMESVCNLIEVRRHETALKFLHGLQREQTLLTQHAHAPLKRVIKDLNSIDSGAGDALVDVLRAQLLTWVPGLMGEHERVNFVESTFRTDIGMVIMASIGGLASTEYAISFHWDEANYSRELTMNYIRDLKVAVRWLTHKANWNQSLESLVPLLGGNNTNGISKRSNELA